MMSITALLSCAAVTLGLGLVAYRLFGTRSARRDLAREWQRSKLGLLSLGAGFVSMLFFFTAMLVPKIWHATRPVPLTAFGLALVCSAALVWQDGRPSTPGTATKTPRPRDEAPIIGPDDGGRGQRGEMPCTCPLGRCVLRFDLRNCHMADGIGARFSVSLSSPRAKHAKTSRC